MSVINLTEMNFERVNVYEIIVEALNWFNVEMTLVQILVTVANIQLKKTENRSRERFLVNNVWTRVSRS